MRMAASLTDDDGRIGCLYCGKRARYLVPHLRHAHGVTADEYRAEHHLPATASMHVDATRDRLRERQRALLAADPHALDHLAVYQTSAHLAEMRDAGRDAVRASHDNAVANSHRRPGRARAVAAMVDARTRKLEGAARAAGFASLDEAIAQTRDLTARAAARRIGVSAQTVTRRRAHSSAG